MAVAEFEHRVAVWDIASHQKICEFETVLDFGGRRLAITPDGTRVIAAAYLRSGVACYCAETGRPRWQRKDIKKTQRLSVDRNGRVVNLGINLRSAKCLDVATGDEIQKFAGVAAIWSSPFSDHRLFDTKSKPPKVLGTSAHWRIERISFAFLDVAFSPTTILISEAGGPLRCFRLSDGHEIWRIEWAPGAHALQVGYQEANSIALALKWSFVVGGDHSLVQIDPESGEILGQFTIGNSIAFGFCLRGSKLIASNGAIYDVLTGKCEAVLDFLDPKLK